VKLKRKEMPSEEFAMTPMIDMVFLLLVFFMCVSSLAQADKKLKLELPESAESKVPENLTDRGVVSVDAAGRVYLGATPVELERLTEAVRLEISRRPGLRVLVRAERSVAFRDIKRVLKACAEAGAGEVIYATFQAD
jgi:biopolymer transport protein ExbD